MDLHVIACGYRSDCLVFAVASLNSLLQVGKVLVMWKLKVSRKTRVNLKSTAGRFLLGLVASQCALPLSALANATNWTIDSKSSKVQFFTKNGASMSVKGSFSDVAGAIQYDSANPENSKVTAKIPLSTISTSINKRIDDLKSVGYFDVAKFANASFVSTKFSKQGGSGKKYLLVGKFTLHGVTKVVDVTMELPKIEAGKNGETRLIAVGTTTVDQSEYNLTLKKLHPDGSVWINKAIAIVLLINAVKGN